VDHPLQTGCSAAARAATLVNGSFSCGKDDQAVRVWLAGNGPVYALLLRSVSYGVADVEMMSEVCCGFGQRRHIAASAT
jgi:hypothetical protein